MFDKVLLAISEREKWAAREKSKPAQRQVDYYDALIRDMKRELCRPGLRTFLPGRRA